MNSGYSSQIAEKLKALQEQNDAREREREEAEKAMAEKAVMSAPVVEQVKPNPGKKKKKKGVSVQKTDFERALENMAEEKAAEEAAPAKGKKDPKKKDVARKSAEEASEKEPVKDAKEEPAEKHEEAADIRTEPEIRPVSENVPEEKETADESVNAAEKGHRAALSASFEGVEEMLGGGKRNRPAKSTVSIAGEDAEKLRAEIRAEVRRELALEAEKEKAAAETTGQTEDVKAAAPKHRGPHAVIQRRVRYVDTAGHPLKDFCLIDISTGEVIMLKDDAVIGKNEMSDIVIQNRYVSRRHARITCEGGEFYIADLGSTNGTFVNDVRLEKNGARKKIEIGDTITFAACNYKFDVLR